MIENFSHNNRDNLVVVTIEEGSLKTIKKRFRGLNVEYLDVIKVANDLGYDISSSISDAAYFILSREIEKLLVEKLIVEEESKRKDIVYIVPKYTPDIKRTVREILRKNDIEAELVVGLLMI
jgi:hypothetical protein